MSDIGKFRGPNTFTRDQFRKVMKRVNRIPQLKNDEEIDAVIEKARLWDSMGAIDKELIKLIAEHKGEAIQLLELIPYEDVKARFFKAWYDVNVRAGRELMDSYKMGYNTAITDARNHFKQIPNDHNDAKYGVKTDVTYTKEGYVQQFNMVQFLTDLDVWKKEMEKILK
jgi:hypothetical protein